MNEKERHRAILDFLKDRPFGTVDDLLAVLDASAATIRRDIVKLHEAGTVRKVFGGVASIDAQASMNRLSARPFAQSRGLAVDAKKAIAAEAEKLCNDGDAVIINGGSTCYLLAQRLFQRSLKIYTNSMPVAALLDEKGVGQLVVSGGELHRESRILFSSQPDATTFLASKLFVGAQGIGSDGVMESHPMLVRTIERLLQQADEVVVLADSRKFSVRARHIAFSLSRIAVLITDDQVAESDVRMLEEEGVRVITASPLRA